MYDAKALMLKILRLVIKREETKEPQEVIGITGRILSLIDIL